MMERLQRLRSAEREIIERFLLVTDWRIRITGVILMTVSPSDAMLREQGLLPVVDTQGSIMNEVVLSQMLEIARATAKEMGQLFKIHEVDTSSESICNDAKKAAEAVAEMALNLIEEHLQEDILHLPKAKVRQVFAGKAFLLKDAAAQLVSLFHDEGKFLPREEVETNAALVQALPVVVVRNATGQVLRLRRRERTVDNPLHEKIVIWAGGHVRKEDAITGPALLNAMSRELD
jgi:hypothetical protein